jgi:hypothetical protein
MAIDANSSVVITEAEAVSFTHSFQERNPGTTKAYFVGMNKINLILDQESCIGIRIYNGYDEIDQQSNLVLVGVNIKGEDLFSGIILERLTPCPVHCDNNSILIKKI